MAINFCMKNILVILLNVDLIRCVILLFEAIDADFCAFQGNENL